MAKEYKQMHPMITSWRVKVGDKIFFRSKKGRIYKEHVFGKSHIKINDTLVKNPYYLKDYIRAKVLKISSTKLNVVTEYGSYMDVYRDHHKIKIYARLYPVKRKRKKAVKKNK